MEYSVVSKSPRQTIELGVRLGRQLRGGEVIAVYGPLGSGKTHLIKGIARGAGAEDLHQVTSPTFVIVNEYPASTGLVIYHIDAYRLDSASDLEKLGFRDYCQPESVVLVEWADKVEDAFKGTTYTRVELEHLGESKRGILIRDLPSYIHL